MNEIIKKETRVNVLGVDALAHNVIADKLTGRIYNQKILAGKTYAQDGRKYKIVVELSFDDSCKNGHETFTIVASIDEMDRGKWRDYMGGCCHEEIVKIFPEFEPLIKWHLTSTDGPMHYVANTCYHASDLDHSGRAAGEPCAWQECIVFGTSPIKNKLNYKFWQWLQEAEKFNASVIKSNPDFVHFEVVAIENRDKGVTGQYQFADKYTFKGYGQKWADCPFDTLDEARDFRRALKQPHEFVKVPTQYSEGKKRNLNAARNCAVWPDATDAQLCEPRPQLEATLKARLPALLAEFKSTMINIGFVWPKDSTNG